MPRIRKWTSISVLPSLSLLFCVVAVVNLSIPSCCQAFIVGSPLLWTAQKTKTSANQRPTKTSIMGIKGFRSWFESQFPDAIYAVPKDPPPKRGGGAPSSSSSSLPPPNSDTFDHVLIDVNQLLHVAVRKSRNEDHALVLLMKELDACVQAATPRQSLVLAMDGPPPAAKLATQRQRRKSVVARTNNKLQLMQNVQNQNDKRIQEEEEEEKAAALAENNDHNNDHGLVDDTNKGSRRQKRRRIGMGLSKRALARKQRIAVAELRTLSLTPGTSFMDLACNAILYWAWQRMSSRWSTLARNNVRIYLSPSTVAGEGEVKLLDWIYAKSRKGGSLAILGGDSDLVLEGLLIPPANTHNVFVILPDGSKRYLVVSLWETTKTLAKTYLPGIMTTSNMMHIRTDLVLLLILNGNDYIPKLRGSSGFNRLFHTYNSLQRTWQENTTSLVDPDRLCLNLDFSLAFFGQLAKRAGPLWNATATNNTDDMNQRPSPLSRMHNMIESGYLPGPYVFEVMKDGHNVNDTLEEADNDEDDDDMFEDDDEEEDDEMDDAEDDDEDWEETNLGSEDDDQTKKSHLVVKLSIGNPQTDNFYTLSMTHRKGKSLQFARQKLARTALRDLMDFEEEDVDEDTTTTDRYGWEISRPAECDVKSYLYGLLWNLQTYQDGVCPDWAYNYGRRLSPGAKDIVAFLANAKKLNQTVGLQELSRKNVVPPLNAGLACLAALPSSVKHLVPEPYCFIPDETVESIYGSCMSELDNQFNIHAFARKCEQQIDDLRKSGIAPPAVPVNGVKQPHDRRILHNDHMWTVLHKGQKPLPHPFDPPSPFADRMNELKKDPRIRVSHHAASVTPRPRSVWINQETEYRRGKKGFVKRQSDEIIHSDPGESFSNQTVEEVNYKVAFRRVPSPTDKSSTKRTKKVTLDTANVKIKVTKQPHPNATHNVVDVPARVKKFGLTSPPRDVKTMLDGLTPLACLKQMEDAGLVGALEWQYTTPATSNFTSYDPENYETIILMVDKGRAPKSVLTTHLRYEQERNIKEPRKLVQQYLASMVLSDVVGSEKIWSQQTFKEIKGRLGQAENSQEKSGT